MFNKYTILIYIIFFCIFNQSDSFAQDSSVAKPDTGFVTITGPDDAVSVFLNNQFIGKTPIRQKAIKAGNHQLEAIPKHVTEWNKPYWRQNFKIAANDTLYFHIDPIRQLYINSQPFDAQVIYQNQPIGKTPLFFTVTDSTTGLLVLRKAGYLDYIIKLNKLKTSFVDAQLSEDKEIQEAKLQFTSIIKNRQKRKKILTYSMLGLTVASGISAIYLKKQADDRYDDYLAATHPADMNRLYDETKQLDNYTAVSYGVFQVSFITSLYLLLFKK